MSIATALSRRTFLRGVGLSGALIRVGLPALEGMFNPGGTAYAATGAAGSNVGSTEIEKRFVFWFNGNGIPEKYWIPRLSSRVFRTRSFPRLANWGVCLPLNLPARSA